MESVKKAQKRFKNYPILLAKCSEVGKIYAVCITKELKPSHKLCEKEFLDFKNCLQKEASKLKTKL